MLFVTMQLTKTITFCEHDLRVTYNFEKGETGVYRDDDGGGVAPTPDEYDIIEIKLGNYEVTHLLDSSHNEIVNLLRDEHEI